MQYFILVFLCLFLSSCFQVKFDIIDIANLDNKQQLIFNKLNEFIDLNKKLSTDENKLLILRNSFNSLNIKDNISYLKTQIDILSLMSINYNDLFLAKPINEISLKQSDLYYITQNDDIQIITYNKKDKTCIIKYNTEYLGIKVKKDKNCNQALDNSIIKITKNRSLYTYNNLVDINYIIYELISNFTLASLQYIEKIKLKENNQNIMLNLRDNNFLLYPNIQNLYKNFTKLVENYQNNSNYISNYNNYYNLINTKLLLLNNINDLYNKEKLKLEKNVNKYNKVINFYIENTLNDFVLQTSIVYSLNTYESSIYCKDNICLELKKDKETKNLEYNIYKQELEFDEIATIGFSIFLPISLPISAIMYLINKKNPFILNSN